MFQNIIELVGTLSEIGILWMLYRLMKHVDALKQTKIIIHNEQCDENCPPQS